MQPLRTCVRVIILSHYAISIAQVTGGNAEFHDYRTLCMGYLAESHLIIEEPNVSETLNITTYRSIATNASTRSPTL